MKTLVTSPAGLSLIRQFEGFAALPYRCPAGWWTLGYGHVLRSKEPWPESPIDEAQAMRLLRADVALSEQAVIRLIIVELTQGQFDALVSFTFNLGSAALERSTLRAKLNRGDVEGASAQFTRWIYAGGRKLQGLVRRRAAEQAMFES